MAVPAKGLTSLAWTTDQAGHRPVSCRSPCAIAWVGRSARPDACRAKSYTRPGRWRAACGGCFEAGACSTWAEGTDCSLSSCCYSRVRRRLPLSSTRRCRRRPGSFTRSCVSARPRLVRTHRVCRQRDLTTSTCVDTDVVVSKSRARPSLPIRVPERAAAARARVAVTARAATISMSGDAGGLSGWRRWRPRDRSRARECDWRRQGYRIWTQAVPAGITPKNRLLLGAPLGGSW